MDLKQTMAALEKLGNPQTKKTWIAHGASGALFGVKVADMKGLLKQIKGQQELALELYATGNLDAMYLAGLVADGAQMTRKQLESWAKAARWQMIAEYTVPWVATENASGRELALKWMDAKEERVASAGWSTYAGWVSTHADAELDLAEIEGLLARVEREIHGERNRVCYCMNGFLIAVGSAVQGLNAKAKAAAKRVGVVEVDMGGTACKVPAALDYLAKVERMGRVGKKRKTIRC